MPAPAEAMDTEAHTESADRAAEATSRADLHLILIDGSGFIFRAFHALPPMNRHDGLPVNAVFGFTNMLAKLLKEHVGTHIAVVFDAGSVTFRNELYDSYKANRTEPPDDLKPQFALVREATAAFGVAAIELEGWEADDLIAAYCRDVIARGGAATIVSSDKDLMQLIRPGIGMLDPIKQKPIGAAEVLEKFGVTPDKLIDVQALMGDSVDNVPGVPGIGPKNAAQLLAEFGDLETVLAAAPAMKPSKRRDALIAHADAARLSRRLVTLRDDAPLPLAVEALEAREPDRAKLGGWLAAMGFRSTIARMGLEDAGTPVAVALRAERPAEPIDANKPLEIEAAHPNAPFGPYPSITTTEALAPWIREAARGGMLAVSVLADNPDATRARLVGIGIATAPGRAAYLPLGHATLDPQLGVADAVAAFGPLLTDPCVLKLHGDAKFDLLVMARAGFPMAAPVDDAGLISYAQEAGLHGHHIEELAALHLGHQPAGTRRGDGHRARPPPVGGRAGGARRPARGRSGGSRRSGFGRRCARVSGQRARWRSTSRWNGGWFRCCWIWSAPA